MNINQFFRNFTRQSGPLTDTEAIESLSADELADVVGGNQFLSKLDQVRANEAIQPVFTSAIDEFLADTEADDD